MAPSPRRLSRAFSLPPGLVAAVLALLTGTAAAGADSPAPAPVVDPLAPVELLVNERNPLVGVLTGGAPQGEEGYRELFAAGFRTFVDLRAEGDVIEAARAAAEAAGLTYESVPVAGEADLDLASARALDVLLDEATRYPIAVACSSGNRVGALLAVEAFWLDGASPEAAFDLGRRAGLTRLEPSVRLLLGLPPAPAPESTPAAPTSPH